MLGLTQRAHTWHCERAAGWLFFSFDYAAASRFASSSLLIATRVVDRAPAGLCGFFFFVAELADDLESARLAGCSFVLITPPPRALSPVYF